MSKVVHIFHHTDLDGMGVKVLGTIYAIKNNLIPKTYCCGYGRINNEVLKCIATENPEEIIIGDISVNKETAELLNMLYKDGVKVKLYDHHETATFLNEYDWATVKVKENETPCCGTKLLSKDPEFREFEKDVRYFVETINDWDTWLWKKKENFTARKLNALLSVLGEDDFTSYILNLIHLGNGKLNRITSEEQLFSDKVKVMLETHERILLQQIESCEKNMYTMNLWTEVKVYSEDSIRSKYKSVEFKTGVVFVNNDLSEIGDRILDNHPELDILLMVVFPGNLSWRTHKDLPVSLSKIAKMATGMGGGHFHAAGSNIKFMSFQDMFTQFMDANFDGHLDYSNFISMGVQRKREEYRKSQEVFSNLYEKAKKAVNKV